MYRNVTLVFAGVLSVAFASIPARGEMKLTASDPGASDYFGYSVAIDGSTALIGARRNDDAGADSGSAYLFDLTNGNQLAKFTASDGSAGDAFGSSVGISGDTAIIGADCDDHAGTYSGSAYLFDLTTRTQRFKLTHPSATTYDQFGYSVAVSGNTALVGVPGDNAGTGSVYVYDVTTGEQLCRLAASGLAAYDLFGISMAISGNTVIVGANGDDDGGSESGSAHLFNVTTGQRIRKLTASDAAAGDSFGTSVAISGDRAIVGAYHNDGAGEDAGAAYVFDVTTGQQIAKLTASDAATEDYFGRSVAISGQWALVGAYRNDAAGEDSGAAYLFDVTTGRQVAKLAASDLAEFDRFGLSAAMCGGTAIVGAYLGDDAGVICGTAYVYAPIPPIPGDANTDGQVDETDASILAGNCSQGNASWTKGDFDNDGVVGPADASILAAHWACGTSGESTTVPEPSIPVLLLTLGGPGLLYHRRKIGPRKAHRRCPIRPVRLEDHCSH